MQKWEESLKSYLGDRLTNWVFKDKVREIVELALNEEKAEFRKLLTAIKLFKAEMEITAGEDKGQRFDAVNVDAIDSVIQILDRKPESKSYKRVEDIPFRELQALIKNHPKYSHMMTWNEMRELYTEIKLESSTLTTK